ncbi:sulfate adenylyltransferase subunit CysN [Bradyrhizobium sp. 62]|uniref:sulfate adenylyltransferase subunit CysN n=1 Tax=Bradyrhizobium sp. 62 TaxID=1043588 RepID=UPI001FF9333A|nr:sulfate adenylyltransferase subunit CysN [Bradyrhizobium sp. 62]MCK1364135.1 sulfate adenylyltransferase subunit CysN [Bradyrhizobium sp. 62]
MIIKPFKEASDGEPTPRRGLLRLLTCGSVDDGKSTLIGRLLVDSKSIFQDQLSAAERDSVRYGTNEEEVDLALLLDGLEAEREQGITIDVAYRFFAARNRSFIVADTPGHEQYTRNMATGASTADLAIILVDARKGLLTQTKRHSFICSLLGIRDVVLAVNKMDLVGYSRETFDLIVEAYGKFAQPLEFGSVIAIPISGRFGANVVSPSPLTPWYEGPSLLDHLEHVDVSAEANAQPFRLPVQLVSRPHSDFRGYSGTVATGSVARGDDVVVAKSGRQTVVSKIVTFDGEREEAAAGDSITLVLGDEIDIARGDVLVDPQDRPAVADQFACKLIWMDDDPMLPGRSYLLKCGTQKIPARITTLKHQIDINTLDQRAARTLRLNEIGICNISTSASLVFDPYAHNRRTGSFILIDRSTNATAGAGMILFPLRRATNIHHHDHLIGKTQHATLKQQKPTILWFTGLSGSGKSTIANQLEKILHDFGYHTFLLDGDNIRHGLNRDLGFTDADRVENIRRVGEVAKLMLDAGLIVICCFISPFRAERDSLRELVGPDELVEIFVDTPIEDCIQRDPKGLYAAALAGKIKNFTGVDSPYEPPERPDIHIRKSEDVTEAASRIAAWLLPRIKSA